MTAVSSVEAKRQEISIAELGREIWRAKWLVAAIVVACAGLAAAASLLIDKKYEASVTLVPVLDDAGTNSLGSLASRYGGLASLVGLSLPKDSSRNEAIALLQSRILTAEYIQDNDLLKVLYADKWDEQKGRWKTTDPEKIPSLWKATRLFERRIRKVEDDIRTGLVTLTIRWKDPKLTAKWANDLVQLTNRYSRARAISESERNIAYLNDQAAKTNIVEARQAIFAVLQEELNRQMIARGREEYAFKIIDPAMVPEKPVTPGLLVLLAAGTIAGLFVAVLVVFGKRVMTDALSKAQP